MGFDIDIFVETRRPDGAWVSTAVDDIYDGRCYGLFGILADVRNYSAFPPISPPRGWPDDCDPLTRDEGDGAHSHTHFTLEELLDFNWDAPIEDRRYTKRVGHNLWDGGATCEPGQGKMTTYREVCESFLAFVWRLKELGEPSQVRLLICFDS